MFTRISISRQPDADRNVLVAKLRFHKGVGPKVAQRVADGETVTIEIPTEELAKLQGDAAAGKFNVAVLSTETPAPDAEKKDEAPMTEKTPAPAPKTSKADKRAILEELLRDDSISEERVLELIRDHAGRPPTVKIEIGGLVEFKGEAGMHHKLPYLLTAVAAGVNVMLVGPAGSGKTTAAASVAKLLGLPFYGTGALDSAYKLSGFIDAQGRVVNTAFRTAFQNGGVFLFDEIDASMPGALLAFNAALANDWCDFPDQNVKRHPDFRVIAGANTFGTGADRQYVGRNQLDAASLDRYAVIDWGYDEALEASFVGMPAPKGAPVPKDIKPLPEVEAKGAAERFYSRVTKVRKAVGELKVRHVVSPRATITGSKLLATGWDWNAVEDAVIWKGLDADTRNKVIAKAN